MPTLDADPFGAAFFGDPFPVHAALRDAGPVVWLPRYGVAAVAQYGSVRTVLSDWRRFTSAAGVGLSDFRKEAPWRVPSIVLEADPPLHDRTRAVLGRVLSAAALRAVRPAFQAAADRMIDALIERGPFDAIPDLAEAYPLQVFPDSLGMTPDDRRFLLPYGNMAFNAFGPRNGFFDEAMRDAGPVLAWVKRQCERGSLSPDGWGGQIHQAADTGELTEEEAAMVVRSVLTAGVDTTVSGLAAALFCLARFDGQFDRLRAEPALARNAFEEAVRYESPVQTFFRTTTEPVEIEGIGLEQGQKVLVFMGAANRDPRKWADADAYDIQRPTVGHVGYGHGMHLCVGMALARLEGECVLTALAHKVARLEITGAIRRRYNNTLRGLASLPMRLHAASLSARAWL